MKYWNLVGTPENWEKAISENVWGVRNNLKNLWDKLEKDDILIFYATRPVGGIIGFGRVKNKFKQDKPLWKDELKENKVIYPFRFDINAEYVLPINSWEEKNINVGDLKLANQAGLNSVINEEAIKKAGFKEVKWHDLKVSEEGIKKMGKEFWEDYYRQPCIVVIECFK